LVPKGEEREEKLLSEEFTTGAVEEKHVLPPVRLRSQIKYSRVFFSSPTS
jgi:hypothetical protein